jgi:hypothetical protein
MLYKFKSQSEAEIIMLQPDGDQMLALVGREPFPHWKRQLRRMSTHRQTTRKTCLWKAVSLKGMFRCAIGQRLSLIYSSAAPQRERTWSGVFK